MSLLQIIILIANIFQVFAFPDLYFNSVFCLWAYALIVLLEFINERRINLIIVFLVAFIYMIPPEGILNYKELYMQWGELNVNIAIQFLIFSSSALFIGYKIANWTYGHLILRNYFVTTIKVIKGEYLLIFLSVFTMFFFFLHLENTIYGLFIGRASAFPFSYSFLLYPIAYIVVGLWSVYFKGNLLKVILLSLPILITLFATGTRFLLLYVIFILFFKDLYFPNFKNLSRIFIGLLIVLITVNVIMGSRVAGLSNYTFKQTTTIDNRNISQIFAGYGSREGLVRNIAMINDYASKNGPTMGKSFGFVGISWIPRQLWADKPVMLDNWLIREYESGFSSGHSTASSYGGELFMDFGFYIGSLIFLIFGFFLYKLDRWIYINSNYSYQHFIISGFLLGWVFFSTRSILTSTYMLMSMLVVSKIIFYILYNLNIIQEVRFVVRKGYRNV